MAPKSQSEYHESAQMHPPRPPDQREKNARLYRLGSNNSGTPSERAIHGGCCAKMWDPVFSASHELKEDWFRSHVDQKKDIDAADDNIESFFRDSDDITCCKFEKVNECCLRTTSEDPELGDGSAGVRRIVWIDNRGSPYRVIHSRTREQKKPMTATQFYKYLRAPRFGNENVADVAGAERRLLYIADLDPFSLLALIATAPSHQARSLNDVFYKNLTGQMSIEVTLPTKAYKSFKIEFHCKYFIFGTFPIKVPSEKTGLSVWRTLLGQREYRVPSVHNYGEHDITWGLFQDITGNSGTPVDDEVFQLCEGADCKELQLEATPSEEEKRDCDFCDVAVPPLEYLPNEHGGLREVMNTNQKLMHIISSSRHMLELLKVTGKMIPLFYRTENYGRPCQSRDNPPFLAKIRSSSSKTALLALFSGFLMSGSFAWLDKNMELYEASAILNKIVNSRIFHLGFHLPYYELIYDVPNEMIFVLFVLGCAGLIGTTITWLKTRTLDKFAFGVAYPLFIASWVLGFGAEEIILVCLPIIIGCSILCSSVLGREEARSMHQEKVLLSEV